MMWWIVGGIAAVLLIFLWLVVHSAARGVDEDTQSRLDAEQTRDVEKILQDREKKRMEK